MCINLTSSSLVKTKTKKKIYLGILQSLSGTVTVKTYICLKINLKINKSIKSKIINTFNNVPYVHEAIGTSININGPPKF